MICAGLSDILYLGGTLSGNSCIVCALLPLLYAPAVTLHSTRIYIHYVDRHVLFVPPRGRSIRFDENPSSDPMLLFAKVYSVCTSNLASYVVVCTERNRVFSIIIIIDVIIVVVMYCTMSTVSSASRCGRFHKIVHFKNSFMSRTSYESLGIVISTLSLVK